MKKNIVWRILATLVICAMLVSGIVMLPENAVKAEEPEAPVEQAAAEIGEEYVPMYVDGTAVLYAAPDEESEVICELEDGTFLFVKEYNEDWCETQAGFFVLAASLRWDRVKKVAEAPVDEEPIDEEPVDEEPIDEEPIDEEPIDEEPIDEVPVDEEPVDEEPVDEEPIDEEPIDEEPIDEEPVDEEPVDEEPVDEEPVDEEPIDEEPIDEEPIDEEPVDEEPVDEEPVDEEPADEEPIDEEPVDEEPVDEEPVDEEPVDEEPVDEEPVDEEPADEEPVDEEPADEEPIDEEPVDEEPVDEEPIDEEPIDEESIDEEPVDEEPVDEEPIDEEPIDEEPVDEEPIDEEPVVEVLEIEDIEIEDLGLEDAVVEEPVAAKPVVEFPEYDTPLGVNEYTTIVLGEDAEVDVREDANGMSAIFASLSAGTEITVVGIDGDWAHVVVNGEEGYIFAGDLAGYIELPEAEIDETDPTANMKVTIFSSVRAQMTLGETVTLSTKIEGFEGYEVRYVWECDKHDGAGFQLVEGENGEALEFAASVESLSWDWQVTVQYR